MKSPFANVRIAAITGVTILLPLAFLQFWLNTVTRQDLPDLAVLFGLLWILSTAFILIIIPLAPMIRARKILLAKPFSLFLRLAASVAIVTMWIGIVIDQLPCFLGIPNCD